MDIFQLFTPKSETFYLSTDSTIRQALEKFDFHKFTVVPLIDKDGKYVTSVSEGDILRYIKNHADFDVKKAENTLVSDIEKYRPYKALDMRTKAEDVLSLALEQNFIPLVDDRNCYIGIIKRKEILKFFYNKRR